MTVVSNAPAMRPPTEQQRVQPASPTPMPFWSAPLEVLTAQLRSTPSGLTSAEAARRRRELGPATMRRTTSTSWARILARQFLNPLVILLTVAAVLSLVVGERTDSGVILVVVVAGGLLGFWQERRAANAVEALLSLVRTTTTVVRDGTPVSIPLEDVVPGDVVRLAAGATLPGDCRLLETHDLFVDESALTGESFPTAKRATASPADAPLRERPGAAFLGTHVVTGSASALIVSRGHDTEFGRLSARLAASVPETEFEHGIRRFGYLLLQATLVLALSVLAVNVARHRPVLESLLFTLALAVGLAPELLPAIVSVTLAYGARAMARARVIVKRLSAIEDLGAMTVLCLDKTGTITEGVVRVKSATDVDGRESEKLFQYAYVNATFESGFANPIDESIRNTRALDVSAFTKLDEVPYDFIRKRLSVIVSTGAERLLITKGSVRTVLDVCSWVEHADGRTEPLDRHRDAIEGRYAAMSADGLRCLAVAYRALPNEAAGGRDDECDLTLLGLLALADPPKPDVRATLDELRRLGVTQKLVTGDNALVAATIARAVGLRADTLLTGPAIRTLSDQALRTRVQAVDVFAEVEPNQKDRIIRALRATGQVVGFLGDGINDATALHSADVGISVETAVDVTKDAADIVLLEKDLSVLVAGLREGRRAFANTLKYIFITTSANFGNMLSMAVASLFTGFLPLLPKQILLINFLTDIPSVAVATDRLDPELVARPRRWDNRLIRNFMIVFGLVSSVFDLLTFGLLLIVVPQDVDQFRTGWFLESVLSEILVLLVIRTERPFFRSPIGRALLIGSIGVAVGSLALPYIALGAKFGLVPVSTPVLLALGTITVAYVATSEVVKRAFFRR
jgi:Mg2+-importing ATPase